MVHEKQAQSHLVQMLESAYSNQVSPSKRISQFKKELHKTLHSLWSVDRSNMRPYLKDKAKEISYKAKFCETSILEKLMNCPTKAQFDQCMKSLHYHPYIPEETIIEDAVRHKTKFNWLSNRLSEIAAPELIHRYKNASKVRMHQAFLDIQHAVAYTTQEEELLDHITEI
jgi:hypothetical protein